MHLCGMNYKYFSQHRYKCNSFGCTAAIRCGNACRGPHSDSLYSGSEHRQFNSPRLVKREAGFPNPRRALIGSNQLWRVNDSPYYREYGVSVIQSVTALCALGWALILPTGCLANKKYCSKTECCRRWIMFSVVNYFCAVDLSYTRAFFTKQAYILPQDLVKSRSRETRI